MTSVNAELFHREYDRRHPEQEDYDMKTMTTEELSAFLGLMMCSDPWPDSVPREPLEQFANAESKRHGYSDWIEAIHDLP